MIIKVCDKQQQNNILKFMEIENAVSKINDQQEQQVNNNINQNNGLKIEMEARIDKF